MSRPEVQNIDQNDQDRGLKLEKAAVYGFLDSDAMLIIWDEKDIRTPESNNSDQNIQILFQAPGRKTQDGG